MKILDTINSSYIRYATAVNKSCMIDHSNSLNNYFMFVDA